MDLKRGTEFRFVKLDTMKEVDCYGINSGNLSGVTETITWKYMVSPDKQVYIHRICDRGYGRSETLEPAPNIEAHPFSGFTLDGRRAFVGDTVHRYSNGTLSAVGTVGYDRIVWESGGFTYLRDTLTFIHDIIMVVDGEEVTA